jgi:thioredoxin reductase (NADPH)
MRNVIIIGSGCAGNTAAVYTARASLKPLVFIGHEPGGQLSITSEVENYPGFPEGILGPDLVENMKKQAERFGAEYLPGKVEEADLSMRPFRVKVDGEWYESRTLIVASGASARWIGLENEQKLIGHGVSSCATCDGFFYRDKKIMVVGGGDTAMEEAIFLTRFGSEVSLVHRRDSFRASKIMVDRAKRNPKINFVVNTVVDDVYDVSKGFVTAVKLRNVQTGETWVRDVDGHRAHSQYEAVCGPTGPGSGRLYRLAWRGAHQHSRRLPRRRRAGSRVPAGHYRRGGGLHGGH